MGFRWSTTRRFLRRLRIRGAHGRLANSLLWKLAGGHGTRPTSALRESWGASDGWISWRKKKRQPTKLGRWLRNLRFLPCVAFGFSVPPESDGEGVGIHLETREVEVVVPALDEWRIAQAAAS